MYPRVYTDAHNIFSLQRYKKKMIYAKIICTFAKKVVILQPKIENNRSWKDKKWQKLVFLTVDTAD